MSPSAGKMLLLHTEFASCGRLHESSHHATSHIMLLEGYMPNPESQIKWHVAVEEAE